MNEIELMSSRKCKLKIKITTGPHPKSTVDEGKEKKLNLFSVISSIVWSAAEVEEVIKCSRS